MEAAAQPLFYRPVGILMKIFQVPYAELAKVGVPVFMRADNTVDVGLRESQANRKPPPAEPVGFVRETHRACGVGQLLAVVLKRIHILPVVNEEAWHAAASSQQPPSAEVKHEATGRERLADDIAQVRSAGRFGRP